MNYSFRKTQKIFLTSLLIFIFVMTLPVFAMSAQKEMEIGRQGGAKMEKKYGVAKQRRYSYRIKVIGDRLAKVQPRKDIRYHFKVLNSNKFNAMAFPGGYIYATKGLMDKLNDGELAFVLGHETGHVVHKHSLKQAEKQILTTLGIFAVTAVVNKGKINQGSANTALVLSAVMSNQYSQADERTADVEGVKLMAKAGYDPKYGISAMKKLKKMSGGNLGVLNTFLGSHPLPNERIAAVEREGKNVAFNSSSSNPNPKLTGKNYDSKTNPGGIRTAGTRDNNGKRKTPNRTKTASASGTRSLGKGGVVVMDPEDYDGELKRVNYGDLKAQDIRGGSILKNWEKEIKMSISGAKSGVVFDKNLDKQAFKYTMEKSQPVITNKRIVWVEMVDRNTKLSTFIREFRNEALPSILHRRSDFTKAGVAVKKNSRGYYHVVVVLK